MNGKSQEADPSVDFRIVLARRGGYVERQDVSNNVQGSSNCGADMLPLAQGVQVDEAIQRQF